MWLTVPNSPGAHGEGAMGWDLDPRVGLGGWAWLLQDESLHVVCRGDPMVSIAWA